MKYIAIAVIAFATVASSVMASTGSTLTCLTGLPCAGGPTRAWNFTTSQFEMMPQCFPWTFRSSFIVGNISDIYTNQITCRNNRTTDFHF